MTQEPTPSKAHLWLLPAGVVGMLTWAGLVAGNVDATGVPLVVFIVSFILLAHGITLRRQYRNAHGMPTTPKYVSIPFWASILGSVLALCAIVLLAKLWLRQALPVPTTVREERLMYLMFGEAGGAVMLFVAGALIYVRGRKSYRAAHRLCMGCGYQLLPGDRTCPECGDTVDESLRASLRQRHDDVVQPGTPD